MNRAGFNYKGCYATYCPHVKLQGNYEVNFTEFDYYIGRYQTKKEAIKAINKFYQSDIFNTYFRMSKLYNQ